MIVNGTDYGIIENDDETAISVTTTIDKWQHPIGSYHIIHSKDLKPKCFMDFHKCETYLPFIE